jgi:hypothetical protein
MPNMSMRTSLLLLLCTSTLMACFPDPPGDIGGGPAVPPDANAVNPCTLLGAPGKAAGFPYDVSTFNQMILPPLRAGCLLSSGCHGPGNPNAYTVYPSTGSDSTCPDEQSFNEVFTDSDYMQLGAMSKIVQKTNGTLGHSFAATQPASMEVTALLETYIDAAKAAYDADGGGGGGFDAAAFASDIQPIFDGGGCIGGCHNTTSRFGNFGLTALPVAGSAELEANRQAVIAKIDATLAADSATQARIYQKATVAHSGSVAVVDPAKLEALRSWIASGLM